jgi:DNA-binding response OmpR family regulator
VVRRGVCQTGMAFLQKPFSPATLTQKVREVLDRNSKGTDHDAPEDRG